ncbi:hypothetical protein BJM27_00005 [Listeria monocytogenes]|nr:hypothetical protein BJM27_00005 [Listeria monocytogenes]
MRLEKTTKAICENLEPVGAGALDSLVNNFTFGSVETIGKNKEVYGDDNRYYVGRLIADSAGIYLGVEGIILGVGTEILGGALDLTGAGAPIGIQLNVAGIGIITGSATVVVNSGANFFQDAKDLSSNIEKGKDKAKSDKSTNATEEVDGSTGTVWDDIKATQPPREGTTIPKSFEINANGEKLWVNPNGTKHMVEYSTRNLSHGQKLTEQQLLSSFQSAVEKATTTGIKFDTKIIIDNWELIFSPAREAGQLPVIKHAVYLP